MNSKKIVLEIDKADYEFLIDGLRLLRDRAKDLGPRSRDLKTHRLFALESHIQDSWEAQQEGKVAR